MAGRLVRRSIMMSPQARTLAVAAMLVADPRARRVARWILLATNPRLRKANASAPATGGVRTAAKGALAVLGAAGLAAFAVREFPAVRREIRIWLM
jgi:hypothetical protein